MLAPDGSAIDRATVQQIEVGRRRGPPGAGRLAVAVAVVLVLVALGRSGDRDEPEQAADPGPLPGGLAPDGPTPTQGIPDASAAPVAPMPGAEAPGADEGALLVYGEGRWTIVQLATGVRRLAALPADEAFDGVVVERGVVVLDHTTGALYYDLSEQPTGPTFVDRPQRRAVRLGPADAVLPADRSDQVWLVHSRGTPRAPLLDGVVRASLVDLHGTVLRRIEVEGAEVLDASAAGVTVARDGQVLVVDERGSRQLAEGSVRAARHGMAVVEACDGDASCRWELVDAVAGDRHLLGEGSSPARVDLSRASDGRLAVAVIGPDGPTVTIFGAGGEQGATVPVAGLRAVPQWLPGDLGLLVASGDVQRLTVPSGRPEVVALRGLDDLPAEVALVIPA